jgi:hypothetical protein
MQDMFLGPFFFFFFFSDWTSFPHGGATGCVMPPFVPRIGLIASFLSSICNFSGIGTRHKDDTKIPLKSVTGLHRTYQNTTTYSIEMIPHILSFGHFIVDEGYYTHTIRYYFSHFHRPDVPSHSPLHASNRPSCEARQASPLRSLPPENMPHPLASHQRETDPLRLQAHSPQFSFLACSSH